MEEEEDEDFTFPTVVDAARAPDEGQPGRGGDGPVATVHLLQFPVPPDLAAAPSPLWPFAPSSSSSSDPSETADGQARPVSGGTTGRAEERRVEDDEKERRGRAAADEERMDLLWEGATAATAAPAASEPDKSHGAGGQARLAEPPKQQQQQRRSQAEDQHDDDDDKQRAAVVADAERMDKLWESFNNEDPDRWFLCDDRSPSTDGAESASSSASPAARRRGYGCAPAMLRASSRAGGAGQFCPRGQRRRGAAAGWALLLRLFRRLFAVDKTSRSPRGGIYVP